MKKLKELAVTTTITCLLLGMVSAGSGQTNNIIIDNNAEIVICGACDSEAGEFL